MLQTRAGSATTPANDDEAYELTIDALIDVARRYGRIRIFENEARQFSVRIVFDTTPGTELTAHSGFGHDTLTVAVWEAIKAAEKIHRQFKP